jgi:hypothetical protein
LGIAAFYKLINTNVLVGLSRPDFFCALIVRADSNIVRPSDRVHATPGSWHWHLTAERL